MTAQPDRNWMFSTALKPSAVAANDTHDERGRFGTKEGGSNPAPMSGEQGPSPTKATVTSLLKKAGYDKPGSSPSIRYDARGRATGGQAGGPSKGGIEVTQDKYDLKDRLEVKYVSAKNDSLDDMKAAGEGIKSALEEQYDVTPFHDQIARFVVWPKNGVGADNPNPAK